MAGININVKPRYVGQGYQSLSKTIALQNEENIDLKGDTVTFHFDDCQPMRYDNVCNASTNFNPGHHDLIREADISAAVYDYSDSGFCVTPRLRDEIEARINESFEVRKWASLASKLHQDMDDYIALNPGDVLTGGPYSITNGIAKLVANVSSGGHGPIVIHGPMGWLQAAAPADLGTLAGRDTQVWFVADPGFGNTTPTDTTAYLYATVGLASVWGVKGSQMNPISEGVTSGSIDNTFGMIKSQLFSVAFGCLKAVEIEWCP